MKRIRTWLLLARLFAKAFKALPLLARIWLAHWRGLDPSVGTLLAFADMTDEVLAIGAKMTALTGIPFDIPEGVRAAKMCRELALMNVALKLGKLGPVAEAAGIA